MVLYLRRIRICLGGSFKILLRSWVGWLRCVFVNLKLGFVWTSVSLERYIKGSIVYFF